MGSAVDPGVALDSKPVGQGIHSDGVNLFA